MNKLHPVIEAVTQEIIKRSEKTRNAYLNRMHAHYGKRVHRGELGCTNLAHVMAAEDNKVKIKLKQLDENATPNIGIVTAYNDMLSAHQPYYRYPEQLKAAITSQNATCQVAGGVPAMCDGVTQGQVGMELSLFSRDVIAMATAVSLSHNVFDGVLCLGICDKIVPGLLIGSLTFGYLPTIFVPSGPMVSGISNKAKTETRKLFAEGKVGEEELFDSELKSYHAPGTCTFYGTANSNQMLMEIMGLHVPGSAFVTPNTPLRIALTDYAAKRVVNISHSRGEFIPLCEVITEKSIVNAIAGLIATGGSTNHTLHLPTIAKICGIQINWDDFAAISKVVPLLAKVYPNGEADVNCFHEAGGVAYVISQLIAGGLVHEDVQTIMGKGLEIYTYNPLLEDGILTWKKALNTNDNILRDLRNPFSHEGGLRVLTGNLGRAVSKVSAIALSHRYVKAAARVFVSQGDVLTAYKNGELNCDCVVVLCYQGPMANGMPELHGLTPALSSLQDQGYKIGLVTDGRMSGASGKIPNAIHLTPDSTHKDSIITKIKDGDIIELDLENGVLQVLVNDAELASRTALATDLSSNQFGLGRELFVNFRRNVNNSEEGASVF